MLESYIGELHWIEDNGQLVVSSTDNVVSSAIYDAEHRIMPTNISAKLLIARYHMSIT